MGMLVGQRLDRRRLSGKMKDSSKMVPLSHRWSPASLRPLLRFLVPSVESGISPPPLRFTMINLEMSEILVHIYSRCSNVEFAGVCLALYSPNLAMYVYIY